MPVEYDVLTYKRPDGLVFNMSDPPYMLESHDGFGVGEFEDTYVDPPGLHGSYYYATRMNAKVVTIVFDVFADGVIERQNSRFSVVDAFNPLLGPGILRIEQVNGRIMEMRCKLAESMSLPTDDAVGVGGQKYRVRLKSDGIPGFYDPTINSVPFAANMAGNFFFPWHFPRRFAQSGYFNTLVLNNAGQIETPVHIRMLGPMVDPIFRNDTTGDTLSFVGLSLALGDVLDINTDPNATSVTRNGVPIWQYLHDTVFWHLAIGANSIVFDIGNTTSDTNGVIEWYTWYLGQ